jgi:FkbM family methyltransferase
MKFIRNIVQNYKKKRFYGSMIHSDDLCFDIGANTGKKSTVFLSLGARVIGFEPQSSCRSVLKKMEQKYAKFNYQKIAVGNLNEEKELFLGSHSEVATFSEKFMDYFKSEKIFWQDKEIVAVRTLNSLIEEFGLPQYCKIDVEGYEWEVIQGLSFIIPFIEFEFTGGFIKETLLILERLSLTGNYRYNYVMNEQTEFMIGEWVTSNQMTEIINSLPLPRLHGNIFARLL